MINTMTEMQIRNEKNKEIQKARLLKLRKRSGYTVEGLKNSAIEKYNNLTDEQRGYIDSVSFQQGQYSCTLTLRNGMINHTHYAFTFSEKTNKGYKKIKVSELSNRIS